MRKIIIAALIVACAGLAHGDERPAASPKTPRRYTDRIEMHDTPFEIEVPGLSDEVEPRIPVMDSRRPLSADTFSPASVAYVPYVPPAPEKRRKKTNWILPPQPEDAPVLEDQEPSGWGWLADDALRLQNLETERLSANAEVFNVQWLPGATSAGDSGGDGRLLRDTSLEPVAGTEPVKELGKSGSARHSGTPSLMTMRTETSRENLPVTSRLTDRQDRGSRVWETKRHGGESRFNGTVDSPDAGSEVYSMPRAREILKELRPSRQRGELYGLRTELDRQRQILNGAGTQGFSPIQNAARSILPVASLGAFRSLTPTSLQPAQSASTRNQRDSVFSGSHIGARPPRPWLGGATPGLGASRALRPSQPFAPTQPLQNPWSSQGWQGGSGLQQDNGVGQGLR